LLVFRIPKLGETAIAGLTESVGVSLNRPRLQYAKEAGACLAPASLPATRKGSDEMSSNKCRKSLELTSWQESLKN